MLNSNIQGFLRKNSFSDPPIYLLLLCITVSLYSLFSRVPDIANAWRETAKIVQELY